MTTPGHDHDVPEPEPGPSPTLADLLTPAAVLAVMARRWWLVALAVLLAVALAAAALRSATPRYTAYLQLVPTEQADAGVSRNISGLASLAGINLPRGSSSQFGYAVQALTSRDTAETLAADPVLMRRLFAAEWDDAARGWRPPDDALRPLKDGIKGVLGMRTAWTPPDAARLQDFLQKNLVIGEDQRRSIVTLSLSLPDGRLAGDVLVKVYRATDAHLRQRAQRRTAAYVAYLSSKLLTVTLAEHREALSQALGEQERVLMLASAGQAFAADRLGDVSVTPKPTSPNPLIFLGVGLVAGVLLGALGALGLEWRRRRRAWASAA